MSKAVASRMSQAVMLRQPAVRRRSTPTVTSAAAAAATSTAIAARRAFASSHTPNEIGQKNENRGDIQDGEDAGEETPPVIDEATAKRTALLKRYGDRTASSGPIAVKVDPAAADAQKAAGDEADHNEIWGDYVSYMEHQRQKGWKT